MKTKYCYGYVRVSTSGQEELSPDSQAKLLKDFAKKNDMIVLQIFYELVTLLDVSVDQFFMSSVFPVGKLINVRNFKK